MSDFADHDHQLYRSHFLKDDELADRPPGRHANGARETKIVESVEKEVDNGWLNIRVGDGEWASARELTPLPADRVQQGRIPDAPPPAESEQPSYADPVAEGIDPTAPDSPESRF